ncbi:Synaptotagmin-9 [Aphelenchoides fujianensis]|nr:Synaptotagmin-9 [Aphelenchoides fujianensis]
MLMLDVADENKPLVLIYTLSGTFCVMVISAADLPRPSTEESTQLNLLECERAVPQYMKCKGLPRLDTDETDDYEYPTTSTNDPIIRKQSRIRRVQRNLPGERKEEEESDEQLVAVGDLTGRFQIPTRTKHTSSMFRSLDQSQIDCSLYPTAVEIESNYDEETGFCGSLKLSLYLDANLSILEVSLKQAIDLVAKRQDDRPNPYFRVSLDVPDQAGQKHQQQTKIFKANASPQIDEDFCFQVNPQTVQQSRLEITVHDYDQFSADEKIGYCLLSLRRVAISTQKDQPTVFWAEVLPFEEDAGTGFGEVLFSTTYLSKAQRLTVNVFKARNLPVDHEDVFSSNSIRVSILDNNEKRLKKKKTSSKKNTRHPHFNEVLMFTIPKSSLCDTILEIEAIHEYGTFGMGHKVLGRMELPLHMHRDLWRAIIREEKSQARWYPLGPPEHERA